ncbi:hypothetical protein Micbo1qcDRAFT_198505 [Microdochium bolleyi]|uniref:Uncharacterized protein n=1 Tax=Microdochium bolleyi TaxID=196109 RepID=A0A136IMW6_9PEZI|nr:hypothetical protein Micbo1qcDRAFT_198505 [Microdochium bolleyi]
MNFIDGGRRPRLLPTAIIVAFVLSFAIVSTHVLSSRGDGSSSIVSHLSSYLGSSSSSHKGSTAARTYPGSHYVSQRDRPLILYAYHESKHARENLPFFLDQGLHSNADFIFIFNGPSDLVDLVPTNRTNIRVVQRDNSCFDLGAFGEVLKEDDLWKRYKHFITLNGSLRGPFTPFWSNQCWSDVYLDELDDKTKLVGMTANCVQPSHLQSMIYATDDVGMQLMLYPPPRLVDAHGKPTDPAAGDASEENPVGYSTCYQSFNAAVEAEKWTTPMIMQAGYHVRALMSSWSATGGDSYWADCGDHPGDPMLHDKAYFGTNVHPYETLFFKSNRGLDPSLLKMMTTLHSKEDNRDRGYKVCG